MPLELAKSNPNLFEIIDIYGDYCRGRTIGDFGFLSLMKLLYPLTTGQKDFTTLFKESRIRFNQSFLRYKKFAMQQGLIEMGENDLDNYHVYYALTAKGYTFWRLFNA